MQKKLSACVQACVGDNYSVTLLKHLMNKSAIDLFADKCQNAEVRRIQWTTYKNLKIWFENWSTDLLELGFATETMTGEHFIEESQLSRIINMDESCLALDGCSGNKGGKPETNSTTQTCHVQEGPPVRVAKPQP